MDTILVTGATGTVGSEVVKHLASSSQSFEHYIIKAGAHSLNKADQLKQNKGFEIVSMDYYNPETISNALKGVDKLFWLTSLAPNAMQISSNLIKEAKQNNVKHIVKLSVIQGKYQKSFSFKMIKKYLLNGIERVIVIRGG